MTLSQHHAADQSQPFPRSSRHLQEASAAHLGMAHRSEMAARKANAFRALRRQLWFTFDGLRAAMTPVSSPDGAA